MKVINKRIKFSDKRVDEIHESVDYIAEYLNERLKVNSGLILYCDDDSDKTKYVDTGLIPADDCSTDTKQYNIVWRNIIGNIALELHIIVYPNCEKIIDSFLYELNDLNKKLDSVIEYDHMIAYKISNEKLKEIVNAIPNMKPFPTAIESIAEKLQYKANEITRILERWKREDDFLAIRDRFLQEEWREYLDKKDNGQI